MQRRVGGRFSPKGTERDPSMNHRESLKKKVLVSVPPHHLCHTKHWAYSEVIKTTEDINRRHVQLSGIESSCKGHNNADTPLLYSSISRHLHTKWGYTYDVTVVHGSLEETRSPSADFLGQIIPRLADWPPLRAPLHNPYITSEA